MKRRYPLESLRSVRRSQVDEQAGEVARQAEQTRQAKERQAQARRAREAAQEQSRRVLGVERQRLESGQARAADLHQADAFARGAQQRESRLRADERAAERRAQAERDSESAARQALCEADVDAKVVDEHHARWKTQLEAERERSDEEAAEEAFAARQRGRPGKGGAR